MCLDTLKLDKNIDRILPLNPSQYIVASYHLDKATATKSGDLNIVEVKDSKLRLVKQIDSFDFGILSIEQETGGIFSMGCSDGTVRIGSDLYIPDQDSSCLHHSTTNTIVASGLNTGTVCIFDRETKSQMHFIPAHKYEIWYTCIVGDIVYSASDDCSFRGFDLRSAEPTLNNTKHHTAGVTFIKPWFEK